MKNVSEIVQMKEDIDRQIGKLSAIHDFDSQKNSERHEKILNGLIQRSLALGVVLSDKCSFNLAKDCLDE